MNNAYLPGYRKKKIPELLRAIDDCTSLSQLFALIQHEIIANNDLPLDRLKAEVKRSVCGSYVPPKLTQAEGELIQAIRDTRTLSELFTLIQREHIIIPMHAQSGASNLTPKKLEPRLQVDTGESPFERFKAEVVKSLTQRGE